MAVCARMHAYNIWAALKSHRLTVLLTQLHSQPTFTHMFKQQLLR